SSSASPDFSQAITIDHCLIRAVVFGAATTAHLVGLERTGALRKIALRRSAHESGSAIVCCAPGSWGGNGAGVYARTAAPKAWKAARNSVRCGCAALIAILTRRTLRLNQAPT